MDNSYIGNDHFSTEGLLEVERLTDLDAYYARRAEAEKRAGELSVETWKEMRNLAKTNLFFLAYSILGYTKLSVQLHGSLCKWIRDTTFTHRYRLVLLPRGHYKSTIKTISHSIQAALTDDSGGEPWPYCLGPDIRILIAHEASKQAAKFLSAIQNHFLSNTALMALFPECIPDPRRNVINTLQLELPRKYAGKVEKTFEVMGVGGASQGNHFNFLLPDDIIGREAMQSKIVMEAANDWVDNLQSFFTSLKEKDRIDFSGTRWAHDDTYHHIKERYGDQLAIYHRAVEEKQPDGTMKAIFPEEYPREALDILRKNKKIWSAQYMNDPDQGEDQLNFEQVGRYYWADKARVIIFDPALKGRLEVRVSETDKLLVLDPAPSKKLGMAVVGMDERSRKFIFETVKDEFTTPKLINKVCDLIIKWNIRALVVEKVNFSALYEHIFSEAFAKRGIRTEIILQSVPTNQKKFEKIATLAEYIAPGTFYINDTQEDLIKEFKQFGASDDVHILDSIWMATKHWRPYSGESATESQDEATKRALARFDPVTGYSSVG